MEKFEIHHKDRDSAARCGLLRTPHGPIETPVFMPVGTSGAVKGLTGQMLEQTGTDIILANTYHLMLRPGLDAIEKVGGLHKFMAWNKPILTDSGGYQIFSLANLNTVDDNGVEFSSHVDGTKTYLTARDATEIQNRLGADIIMCLDQCTAYPCQKTILKEAVERTIRWAKLCKDAHCNSNQMLFGIVQGGTDRKLREHCAAELIKLDFDGYALGGLSVGEGHENMIETVRFTTRLLGEDKPRYLMGVGTPADIIAAVAAGVDMFDCVICTRNGRNAYAFSEAGPVRMRNNAHIADPTPIEPGCDCYCCVNFSRSAVRHFFNIGEMLGPILVSLHNIRFYQRLMTRIRTQIRENRFASWLEHELPRYRTFTTNNHAKNTDEG